MRVKIPNNRTGHAYTVRTANNIARAFKCKYWQESKDVNNYRVYFNEAEEFVLVFDKIEEKFITTDEYDFLNIRGRKTPL